MNINKAGLKIIKDFEQLRLKSYLCPAKIPTIGFGHTGPEVKLGQTITLERAEELLKSDLAKFEKGVNALSLNLNPNQFSSLVSFSYNVGLAALQKSTLVKKIRTKDFIGASQEFLRWTKAGGKELRGLYLRRQAEQALFLS